jgi:A/G-specific adenine glycosylase
LAQKVVPVYRKLFSRYPEPGDLADADVKDVAEVLEPLGLQNRRAKALVEIGELLSERDVPQSESELLELPFVGKYAANATLCFSHDQKRPVVDVNVVRVYSRVFDFDWSDDQDEKAWDFAEEMLPDDDFQRYNLAIIDLGGLLCTSTNPSCEQCPLSNICRYYEARTE